VEIGWYAVIQIIRCKQCGARGYSYEKDGGTIIRILDKCECVGETFHVVNPRVTSGE
jgi:hypothetical protein